MSSHIFSSYPTNLLIDFRKLEEETLLRILKYYNVELQFSNFSKSDLAHFAARVFEASGVVEDNVIINFIKKNCYSGADKEANFRRRHYTREDLERDPAEIGEQIAAKTSKPIEEGSWILANVLEYDANKRVYKVQDEDDSNRIMVLLHTNVKRLDHQNSHLKRGDEVLAVFPETTSFYPAIVAKKPKPPINDRDEWTIAVKFHDDEDSNGKNLTRRVPARHVLCLNESNEHTEDEN